MGVAAVERLRGRLFQTKPQHDMTIIWSADKLWKEPQPAASGPKSTCVGFSRFAFRVWGEIYRSEFGVWGVEFGVWDLGFRA